MQQPYAREPNPDVSDDVKTSHYHVERHEKPNARTERHGEGAQRTHVERRIRSIDSKDTKAMPTPTSRVTRENGGPAADVERRDDRWVLEQSRLALHWYLLLC